MERLSDSTQCTQLTQPAWQYYTLTLHALNKAIIILTIALLQGIDISMVSYDGILYASLGPEQLGIAKTEVAEVGKFTL